MGFVKIDPQMALRRIKWRYRRKILKFSNQIPFMEKRSATYGLEFWKTDSFHRLEIRYKMDFTYGLEIW
ncbi:UNVERIFIED_CONTAM: hypothetical protein NCL1_54022 [Trichonephila clavipes]